MTFSSDDQRFMAQAIALAKKGAYSAKPNPVVGCVIVKDGEMIGEGWHQKAGQTHAEINALAQTTQSEGATAYVTLEPCSHQGRTPPCADRLIDAKLSRVVYAMEDPNPQVSGQGAAKLEQAGIQVEKGLLEVEAKALNAAFCHKMTTGFPLIFSKIAMSLDGHIAMASGESQWITGEKAREDVHRLRASSDVVLTGIKTVLADNPKLTVRQGVQGQPVVQPDVVILDSQLQTPVCADVLSEHRACHILTCSPDQEKKQVLEKAGATVHHLKADDQGRVCLRQIKDWFRQTPYNNVMVESGSVLNGALMSAGLIEQLVVYIGPKLLGRDAKPAFDLEGLETLANAVECSLMASETLGGDLKLTYHVKERSCSQE